MSLAPLNRSAGHALITAEGLAQGGISTLQHKLSQTGNHLFTEDTASVDCLLLLDRREWSLARELTVLFDASSTPQHLIVLKLCNT